MLATLENDPQSDWKSFAAPLVKAYNSTKSEVTGYSPHYLMFGWQTNHQSYAEKLRGKMHYAYKLAAQEVVKNTAQDKKRYDQKVHVSKL